MLVKYLLQFTKFANYIFLLTVSLCILSVFDESSTFVSRNQNPNLLRLVEAYRRHGHLKAAIDPLNLHEAQ